MSKEGEISKITSVVVQKERDGLFAELEKLATTSDEQTHKMQETYGHKLKDLEAQVRICPKLPRKFAKCYSRL